MVDHLSSEERSRNMSRVKGRDTKPERLVRSLIHSMGFRFSLYRKDLPGRPDIVLTRHRKLVFVHGCFWHGHPGCSRATMPSTNIQFWEKKISGNRMRDVTVRRRLGIMGWRVLVIWQCQTKNTEKLKTRLARFLAPDNELLPSKLRSMPSQD